MKTECIANQLEFQGLGKREVVAAFDGGRITSDAGALLLGEVEARRKIISRFAACFTDHRDPEITEHSVLELLRQRIYGLALGYEDLNDHDQLRHDALLATLVGKIEPTGEARVRARDRGVPLAGKSTLNRLELSAQEGAANQRYKKISVDDAAIRNLFVDLFIDAHDTPPAQVILDLDATDDPLHGQQEGRFFHGYYGNYCYLPLYIFCGDHLLLSELRPSNIDAAAGAVGHLARIVGCLRERWPGVQVIVRGDSGFCREELLSWCEANAVDFLVGLAKNRRLLSRIVWAQQQARLDYARTLESARVFQDFQYATLSSWSRARRVVAKAEHLEKGPNPRFVVTSLAAADYPARELYEELYCARGEMENRIKEQQLDLFADRTSTHGLRSNQLRLWLSSLAYTLVSELRRLGLSGTELARAQCGTIRLKLFKNGALVKVSVRRVRLLLAEGYAYKDLFLEAWSNLRRVPLRT